MLRRYIRDTSDSCRQGPRARKLRLLRKGREAGKRSKEARATELRQAPVLVGCKLLIWLLRLFNVRKEAAESSAYKTDKTRGRKARHREDDGTKTKR